MAKTEHKWLKERKGGMTTEANSNMTVGDLYDGYKSGRIYFPIYQRDKLWNNNLKRGLIISLVDKTHIPPMVFADKKGKLENIDGKQRIMTIVDLLENKFKLPSTIPKELGGDKYFKEASVELQEYIKSRVIPYTYLINPSEETCQKTFLRLQQGIKLTIGEMIHASYGPTAELVENIIKTHPINSKLRKDRFMNYRIVQGLLLLETKYANSLDNKTELAFLNDGLDKKMFDTKQVKSFKHSLDRMNYCLGGEYLHDLSVLRAVGIYVWLRRNETLSKTKKEGLKINEFLTQYYKNVTEISEFMKSNPNTGLNEDALKYIVVKTQRRSSSSSNLKVVALHLEQQYKLFLNGTMNHYDRKLGNMCMGDDND